MNNFEKPNRIEELEKKLYSPNQELTQKERKPLNIKQYDVKQDWEGQHEVPDESIILDDTKKPNWFFRLFIVALIFFLGALGYVGVKMYLNWGINASDVDILVNAPLTVPAGEEFAFETVLQNKNQIPIKFVEMEVVFPNGTRHIEDISKDYKDTKDVIETIAVGEIIKRNYSALLFGEENEKKEITINLKYQVDNSTVLFNKQKKFDVVLSSTPIRLTVTNVQTITSGQELAFTIELVSNSTETLQDVMVQASYPYGFIYKNSSIKAEEDNKTWIISSMAPKETVTFNVRGTINGQNKDDKFFTFLVGLKDKEKSEPQVVFTKKSTTITLEKPFLDLALSVAEQSGDIIILDPEVNNNAVVSFTNNTNFQLRNAQITLSITGNPIREDSIQVSEGFYQSLTDIITWDSSTSNKLISIPAGGSGKVTFGFTGLGVMSNYIKINPEAIFTLKVKANRNPQTDASDSIESSLVKKIRFNTQLKLDSWSEYYSSVFSNTGPIPPKVEQKTTYTAFVRVKNSTNSIDNSIVTMKVPNYVQYDGSFYPSSENVSYDSVTRTITWNIGGIPSNTGYQTELGKTLALQLSIIPSVSQAGTAPILLDAITISGVDSYTKQDINKQAPQITTGIKDSEDFYSSRVSR